MMGLRIGKKPINKTPSYKSKSLKRKKPAEAGYFGFDRMPSLIFLINKPRSASRVPE